MKYINKLKKAGASNAVLKIFESIYGDVMKIVAGPAEPRCLTAWNVSVMEANYRKASIMKYGGAVYFKYCGAQASTKWMAASDKTVSTAQSIGVVPLEVSPFEYMKGGYNDQRWCDKFYMVNHPDSDKYVTWVADNEMGDGWVKQE